MKKVIFWLGFIVWLISTFSGFEIFSKYTGWEHINILTKDLVLMLFGITWMWLAILTADKS